MSNQRPLEACPICYTKHTVPEMFRDEVTGNYHYPVTDCQECGAKLTVVVPIYKENDSGFRFKLITIGLKRLEYN